MAVKVSQIKFYYEVLGDSPEFIGERLDIAPAQVIELAKQGGWTRAKRDEQMVKDTFRETREYLALHEARRARDLAAQFADLEDAAIQGLTGLLTSLAENVQDSVDVQGNATALQKLVTSFSKLLNNHSVYHESVMTQVLRDRKDEGVNENPLDKLIKAIDGAGRALPSDAK